MTATFNTSSFQPITSVGLDTGLSNAYANLTNSNGNTANFTSNLFGNNGGVNATNIANGISSFTPSTDTSWLNTDLTKEAASTTGTNNPTAWQELTGYKDAQGNSITGYGTAGIQALSGIGSMYSGVMSALAAEKQYELAKATYETNKAGLISTLKNDYSNQYARNAARGQSNVAGTTESQYVANKMGSLT